MVHHLTGILAVVAALAALSSIFYYAICLWSALRFLRARKAVVEYSPAVSILKPLKGTDPEMYASFRSHCLQEYPEYEIVFGVSDPRDPAIPLVEELKREFPQRAIRLVVCSKILGTNVKVSNLAQMVAEARYEHLIVNDSDIRVEPDYLHRVLAPFADPNVGMVTCLYRGRASATLGSRLESLGISTDFAAGVLVARQLEGGISFGLGSTLAFRRSDLQAIGGFEVLLDYLSDDYELGHRIAATGKNVELSEVVVETYLPTYTFAEFWRHQLRWARSIRDSRRWGYMGYVVTFGLPWAVLPVVLTCGALWAWLLLLVTASMRFGVALIMGRAVLQDRQIFRGLWLLPLRDVVALLVWMASFAGHTVSWRGETFLLKDGKLHHVSS